MTTLPVVTAQKRNIKKLNHQWIKSRKGLVIILKDSRNINWCDLTGNDDGGCKHACRWKMTRQDGQEVVVICYAEALVERMKHHWQHGFDHYYYDPTLLESIQKYNEPALIFMGSMTDKFGAWIPQENTNRFLEVAAGKPQLTFQLLTKDAKRTRLFDLPPNVWMGFSSAPDFLAGRELTDNQKLAFMRTALEVAQGWKDKGLVSWFSFEPMSWDVAHTVSEYAKEHNQLPFKWAVIGAGTDGKKSFQPQQSHVLEMLELVDHYQVPVFFKNNLNQSLYGREREDFPVNRPYHHAVVKRQLNALEYGWPINQYLTTDKTQLNSMLLEN